MERKVIALFLSMCLVGPLLIAISWLHFQKIEIRRQVKQNILTGMIDNEDVVLLKLSTEESTNQLNWKHSREFEYNGQMYDVVKFESHGDTIYYWCWEDTKETKLGKQIDELLAKATGNDDQSRRNKSHIIFLLKSVYVNQNIEWPFCRYQLGQVYINHICGYGTLLDPPLLPPPRLV